MKIMQLPVPKKMEYMIRDSLISKLQANTFEEVVDGLLNDITTIDPEEPIKVRRYKNAMNLVYSKDELREITEGFIQSFKVNKKFFSSSNDSISGAFACGGLCIGLIGAGAGALAGYLLNEWDETEIEEMESDTGWDCEFEDYAFSLGGIFSDTDYCWIVCYDRDGDERSREAEECPDGFSSH